jgi:hypothetical protein
LFRDAARGGENLERKIVAAIMGMVGGVLLMVGVVVPWISSSVGISTTVSGIDVLEGGQPEMLAPILLLVGGILALVGGIGKLVEKKAVGYLMPIGAILAIVGWGWALKIGIVTVAAGGVHISYGIFVGLAGILLVGLGLLPPRKRG